MSWKCQTCQERRASVHVTDVPLGYDFSTPLEPKHVCDECAQRLDLPHMPVSGHKAAFNIWAALKTTAERGRQKRGLSCPDCGMTLSEFRSKGRLGCPKDYEVFREHLDPLLQRIHNATEHVGRAPEGEAQSTDLERRKELHELRAQLTELRAQLRAAIREEEYEHAARLRDEIQALESSAKG